MTRKTCLSSLTLDAEPHGGKLKALKFKDARLGLGARVSGPQEPGVKVAPPRESPTEGSGVLRDLKGPTAHAGVTVGCGAPPSQFEKRPLSLKLFTDLPAPQASATCPRPHAFPGHHGPPAPGDTGCVPGPHWLLSHLPRPP